MRRKQPPPVLTRAEADVMQALWRLERATVRDVAAALPRPLAYTTVLTMLRILEGKGYVRHEPAPEGGRAYLYAPAVSHQQARRSHVRDLVARLFDGKTPELVTGLIEDEALSREELTALRDAIDARLSRKRR